MTQRTGRNESVQTHGKLELHMIFQALLSGKHPRKAVTKLPVEPTVRKNEQDLMKKL